MREHEFFREVDWEAVYYRRVAGPILPRVRGASDASNYDEYEEPDGRGDVYTGSMMEAYEEAFADF